MLRRLPLDTSSFKQIREKGWLYVDKTPWIYKLLKNGVCYFISRPRRFGKSLTISVLKELFSGNKNLFEGLYIYDKWDFKPHPVLIFDFNLISRDNPEILKDSLNWKMQVYAEDYRVKFPERKTPKENFEIIIKALYQKYKAPVIILIDEYDKAIIDHLGLGEKELEIAKENRRVLKEFFGVLKGAGVVDELGFVFVTGVSYFTKVSIFSEWNNLVDLTFHPEFADFLGYTEEEVLKYFTPHLEVFCEERGFKNIDECMEEIRFWYNGYRFSPDRDVRVYNPISVMYALTTKKFDNYWFQTATPTFLVNLLKERFWEVPDLEHLEVEMEIFKAYELENLPVEAILYQAGYLTIKEVEEVLGTVVLSYPNQEVKKSFCKILFWQGFSPPISTKALSTRLVKALYKEDFSEAKELLNEILAEIPCTLFARADERLFHVIFYLILNILGYHTEAELLTSRGRLDMVLKFPDKIFIFEFKAGRSAEEALSQIREKGYHEKFLKERKPIFLVGVSFDVKERKVKDVQITRLNSTHKD